MRAVFFVEVFLAASAIGALLQQAAALLPTLAALAVS